jgi:hypothetical protein
MEGGEAMKKASPNLGLAHLLCTMLKGPQCNASDFPEYQYLVLQYPSLPLKHVALQYYPICMWCSPILYDLTLPKLGISVAVQAWQLYKIRICWKPGHVIS